MQRNMNAISLFAGAGGCSLGFSKAGVNIMAAYDNARPTISTYNMNFSGNRCHNIDLSNCNIAEIMMHNGLKRGELDLIIGGPPCQGFTTAGNRFWDDPRNKLVKHYVQILETIFPRWFMMENVEGILTTAKGVYLFEAIQKMARLGYSVYLKKIYLQEYGVPQRRKRVIIIGNREGKKFNFPEPVEMASGAIYRNCSSTLRDAISDLEDNEIPEIDHVFKIEDGIQLERIIALAPGKSMKDLPERLQNDSFKRRSSRRVCDGTPSEKRGGPPSGLKRLLYDEPSLTITSAATSEFVHPRQNRTLTIRECARIQTFPDDFKFCGTDSEKILQIGNAIPPIFAEQMANQIIKCDNNLSHTTPAGLIFYDVTKASAKSPALERTCLMLDQLLASNYVQLKMEGL